MNKRLRNWMQESNISQTAFAKKMGYTREYVNRVLNGHTEVSGSFKWRFAEAYGFDVLSSIVPNGAAGPTS